MALFPSVPQHIAIIMDGNRRWANQRGLPKNAGHKAGADALRRVAKYCDTLGVRYLTLYAFSTENWKRANDEVAAIMLLLENYLKEALRDMEKNQIRFCIFGDIRRLSPRLQELCEQVEERSAAYNRVQVNICMNYGGRDEIVRAARAFAEDVRRGKHFPEELTEDLLSQYLDSAGVPDPELVIRPSGERRISNFLPWQSAYSEFVFMDVLWPDFDEAHLNQAIAEYCQRSRRFGGT